MRSFVRRGWVLFASMALILALLCQGCFIDLSLSSRDKDFAAIEDAWKLLRQEYVDPDSVDFSAVSKAAVQAMMDALNDSHSAYLTQQQYEDYLKDLAGNYSGIGVYVTAMGGQLIITRVFSNSPAEAAGVQAGDVLLEIDGISTSGMTITDLSTRMRGEIGTQVVILVHHKDATEPTLMTITRAEITIPSVSLEMRGEIACIGISHFNENTNDELGAVLKEIAGNGAKGIIVDLRDNPGGLISAVVDAVSRFIKSGTVLTICNNDGSRDVVKTTTQKETTDLPMAVLVNANSASASEVFSGALQDHGRAVIVGEVTYGKGSVNVLYKLSNGSAIYLTVARWLTPNDNLIEGHGITPDYELRRNVDWVQWSINYLKNL